MGPWLSSKRLKEIREEMRKGMIRSKRSRREAARKSEYVLDSNECIVVLVGSADGIDVDVFRFKRLNLTTGIISVHDGRFTNGIKIDSLGQFNNQSHDTFRLVTTARSERDVAFFLRKWAKKFRRVRAPGFCDTLARIRMKCMVARSRTY